MRKIILFTITIAIMIPLVFQSCNQKGTTSAKIPMDSAHLAPFFESYPVLKKYENDLVEVYRNYNFNYIWFNEKGIEEYGNSLYVKVIGLKDDGISSIFPYQKKIDEIFKTNIKNVREHPEADLLMTSLYLFYVNEVYKGIDHETTDKMGWKLPRKDIDFSILLDSIISAKKLQREDSLLMFSQYYKLREALKRYRTVEMIGGWNAIDLVKDHKAYKPGDTSVVIQQIRERLFKTGEISENSRSNIYDAELVNAVKLFQLRNGYKVDSLISTEHIEAMNVTIGERIKTIIVNMERCRWVLPEFFRAEEYIFVNIPSYRVNLVRNGKIEFDSPVVVGDEMTKTDIFDGKMSYIVFSPYWNVPKSIIENEVIPGIAKNKNYLKNKNMEWNGGQVRQLPGKNNSLGLVKFMFPNSNDIYLHDTPAKSLFNKEDRSLSHGCIRVEKARELALTILKDDKKWTPEKIDAAMHSGKETTTSLKSKIPVYIGYFTAWVDDQGQINFYKDVYERDERVAALLFHKK